MYDPAAGAVRVAVELPVATLLKSAVRGVGLKIALSLGELAENVVGQLISVVPAVFPPVKEAVIVKVAPGATFTELLSVVICSVVDDPYEWQLSQYVIWPGYASAPCPTCCRPILDKASSNGLI